MMQLGPVTQAIENFPWKETIAGSVALLMTILGIFHIIMLRKSDNAKHTQFLGAIENSYRFVQSSQQACHDVQKDSVRVMESVTNEMRESRATRERHIDVLDKIERRLNGDGK